MVVITINYVDGIAKLLMLSAVLRSRYCHLSFGNGCFDSGEFRLHFSHFLLEVLLSSQQGRNILVGVTSAFGIAGLSCRSSC